MADVEILSFGETGNIPGALGRITELHALYYSQNWRFGIFFEAKVAREIAEFLTRFDNESDLFLVALKNGRVEGGIALDGSEAEGKGAHLRWFIMSDAVRGSGVGNMLMEKTKAFAARKGIKKIYLTTFRGLGPARHLYEKYGFDLVDETKGITWGVEVSEQLFIYAESK